MEKNDFRKALRIWLRLVLWVGRLLLSLVAILIFLFFGLFDSVSFLYYWANEKEDVRYYQKELRDHWNELKEWMSY